MIPESELATHDAESVSTGAPQPSQTPEHPLLAEKLTILARAFENAPDGIQIADMSGIIVYANKAIESVYGFTPEEQIGKHVGARNAESGFAAEHIVPSLRSTGRWEGEVLTKHKDGRIFPIWLTTSVLSDEHGNQMALMGIARDMTEVKRVEAALIRSETKYRKLLELANDAVTASNRTKELSDSLNEISKIINSTLDVDEILDKVVMCSAEALGSETTVILLRQKNEWMVRCAQNIPAELIGSCLNERQIPHIELAAASRNPVVINDFESEPHLYSEFMQKYGVRSTMVVPLIVRDVVIGCQTFSYHSSAISFTPDQIDFAVKLGASISLALENARLFSEQQAIARTLQESLLVVPEKLPHVEFEHLYRSASEAALVGGDFYDLFALQGDRIAIAIGDVSGKGLEAAALTSMLKHTIKGYAFEGHSPGAIISKTNVIAMKELDSATFVTIFVGILDTQSGLLTYCCAGHPPPIIKRQNGDIDLLETSCPPIGVLDFLDARDKQQRITEGDFITLYTDGVIEARCESDMFGENRLIEFIQGTTALSATEAPGRILDELTGRCGCTLPDDLAVVSLSLKNGSLAEG